MLAAFGLRLRRYTRSLDTGRCFTRSLVTFGLSLRCYTFGLLLLRYITLGAVGLGLRRYTRSLVTVGLLLLRYTQSFGYIGLDVSGSRLRVSWSYTESGRQSLFCTLILPLYLISPNLKLQDLYTTSHFYHGVRLQPLVLKVPIWHEYLH